MDATTRELLDSFDLFFVMDDALLEEMLDHCAWDMLSEATETGIPAACVSDAEWKSVSRSSSVSLSC